MKNWLSIILLAWAVLSGQAQSIITPEGIAAFKKVAPSGGGGGCTPNYANTGGTGDRRSIISTTLSTIGIISGTALLDGDTVSNGRNFFTGSVLDGTSFYFIFDFGSGNSVQITESKYYQQNTTDQGVWKWQGSNDALSWSDIGGTFNLVTTATTVCTTLSGNTTSYRYYRMLGMSGFTSNGPWIYQMEFKICGLP